MQRLQEVKVPRRPGRKAFTTSRNSLFRLLEQDLALGQGSKLSDLSEVLLFELELFATTYAAFSPYFSGWTVLSLQEKIQRVLAYYSKVRSGYETTGLPLPWKEVRSGS